MILLISVALAVKLHYLFIANINWDEFHYLSYIYDYTRGELVTHWTTFHVHLFSWLTALPVNEISQVVVTRLILFALSLGSVAYTFLIARRFVQERAALFSVLCYLSFSYILFHGVSFRPDPICTFLFLASLHLLLPPKESPISAAVAGLLMAVSLMLTVKSVVHVATLAACLLIALVAHSTRARFAARRIGPFVASLGVAFTTLYLAHRASLVGSGLEPANEFLQRTGSKMLMIDVLFPGILYLAESLKDNPIIWTTLLIGLALAVGRAVRPQTGIRSHAFLILAMTLPLGTLVFYRNAFPYYYVFIISPAIVLCGLFMQKVLDVAKESGSRVAPWFAAVLTIAVFANGMSHYIQNLYDQIEPQREVVETVHKMFPEPVPYIDRCSMISSYPKRGWFMSSWGMQKYLKKEDLVIRELIESDQPPLLIANVASLDLGLPEGLYYTNPLSLRPQDYAALRDNYIRHWGPIYLAGKRFRFSFPILRQEFDIKLPGTYTFDGDGPVTIDGREARPGDTIELARGEHLILASGRTAHATLRWGNHPYRPEHAPSRRPVFLSF